MLEVSCPVCGEDDDLSGSPSDEGVVLACGSCGTEWLRSPGGECAACGGTDLQTVPLAIVERSRGTQLSVVGTRPVVLCSACDAGTLRRYHANRPNPLMPDELPTRGEEQMNG